jgi:hypothetical protein
MIDSAHQARAAASAAGFALRLVNEAAAEALVAAVDGGESRARIRIGEVPVPVASGRIGRLYGDRLVAELEEAGEHGLVRAVRIFAALGFDVSSVPRVEREDDREVALEKVTAVRLDHLELGFATAVAAAAAPPGLMQSVALPAAYLWRARAEAARRIDAFERKALAMIGERADRGADTCRIAWPSLAPLPADARLLQRLAERLRSRGFGVECDEGRALLDVRW